MELHKLLIVGLITSSSLLACGPISQKSRKLQFQNQKQSSELQNFIVGGTDVLMTDKIRRSVVAVYDDAGGQLCTGVLITKDIVVTAAHCIGFFKEHMYIAFDNFVNSRSILRQAKDIEISPYWESRKRQSVDRGDIALIQFVGDMPEGYEPALFLSGEKNLVNGATVVIAGFGFSDPVQGLGLGVLRQASTVISDIDFSSTEALLDQKNGQGACHGDSGGPAYIERDGKYLLWAITSRGVADVDERCDTFSAYTKISAHKTWMNRMINKLSKPINSIDIR